MLRARVRNLADAPPHHRELEPLVEMFLHGVSVEAGAPQASR